MHKRIPASMHVFISHNIYAVKDKNKTRTYKNSMGSTATEEKASYTHIIKPMPRFRCIKTCLIIWRMILIKGETPEIQP